jgi:hypothetical protein
VKFFLKISFFFSLLACHRGPSIKINNSIDTLPDINFLLTDSITSLNIRNVGLRKSVLIFYFNPDCEHCQLQTRQITKNINLLQDVQIIFLTPATLQELAGFSQYFKLDNYKNILTGRDYKFNFFNLFKVQGFPYTVIYGTDGRLAKLYSEKVVIDQIIKAIHD